MWIQDERGTVVDRWALPHTEQALTAAFARLARHGDPAELQVIIERPEGLVVDRLLAAGHPVFPVHPTAFHAARPRWGASGAKSDPGDSYKLADYLRTDGHRLRRLPPTDPGLAELQSLTRLREDHVRARTAATNQLAALLDAHCPGPRKLFQSLASPIALAFLTDYPTPDAARRLRRRTEADQPQDSADDQESQRLHDDGGQPATTASSLVMPSDAAWHPTPSAVERLLATTRASTAS